MRYQLLFLVLWLVGLCLAVPASAATTTFSDDLGTECYDCTLVVQPAAGLPNGNSVALTLEYGDDAAYTSIDLNRQRLMLESVRDGRTTRVAQCPAGVTPGTPYRLTISRRGQWLALLHDDTELFAGDVVRPTGTQGVLTAEEGWTVTSIQAQRLEPVSFADNFMRTADEPGSWRVQSGQWGLRSAWDTDSHGSARRFQNKDYAQNPFAWAGRAVSGGGLCTAGEPFWEEYTYSVAVCPAADGAVGAAINVRDGANYLLARWTPGNAAGTDGDRLTLYQVVNGTRTMLAQDRGGYIPGQWYQLTLVTDRYGVRVLVDGRQRLAATKVTPRRGGVGLYVEGKEGAVFDDVTVHGSALGKEKILEAQQARIGDRFRNDPNGMAEWAVSVSDWAPFYGVPDAVLYRYENYGDHWMTATLTPRTNKAASCWLLLNGDGRRATSGYRALLETAGDGAPLTCTLYRDETVLQQATCDALVPGDPYTVRFWHLGKELRLELDGQEVLRAVDDTPLPGRRAAYRTDGAFGNTKAPLLLGRQVLDYAFTEAPVDWTTEGNWESTVRWACSPNWSFFAGWSRGDAVLWHKKRFTGDQTVEAFVGLKMEYPREQQIYDARYRDFAITICGDGYHPRTGYTGIFGAPGVAGSPIRRTVLLRDGVEVASAPVPVPGRNTAHREWFHLELRKRGDTVEFWVENTLLITYTDPTPIAGGVPAVWTNNNGICLARARIFYAEPPQPRTDPQVELDAPWYAEWGNVNQPLALDFSHAWSTAGKPVTLAVAAQAVPPTQAPPTVEGGRVTFTPTVATAAPGRIGGVWYTITGSDGVTTSPTYHLNQPIFDPAPGRDDSHAVVLYRFDEGDGEVVHDRGTIGPALDLAIPKNAEARWTPTQGLHLQGAVPVRSTTTAEKLMATAQAGTVELWISNDTLYPPTGWMGTLLSWETAPTARNFAVGHQTTRQFITAASQVHPDLAGNGSYGGFRTGLQHLVFTWDGTNVCCYLNGASLGARPQTLNPAQWSKEATLLLGNISNGTISFVGTYYLVAIHDRALAEADVKRHFLAGPSAR